MSIDISSITSASRYNGMTVSTTSSLLGSSATSAADLLSSDPSVSSNGIDLVALSAQALVDEAGEVTGLGSDADLSDLMADLSPTAVAGLLDSTSDQAVLQAVFGSTSIDSMLTSVVSSTTGG